MGARLQETFTESSINKALQWMNPPVSRVEDGQLVIEPKGGTDFWQQTCGLGDRDTGPFLHVENVRGDFIVRTRVHLDLVNLYDQGGLMVRFSKTCWIKTNVEKFQDRDVLAVVVTNNGISDASKQTWLGPPVLHVQIRRQGLEFTVEAEMPGRGWEEIRLTRLAEDGPEKGIAVGLYAICPTQSGLKARFDYLTIGSPADDLKSLTPANKVVEEPEDFPECSADDKW